MGFDVNRFVGEVSEEFICSICSGVLDEPSQTPDCEHCFCTDCISKWVTLHPTCPVDRSSLTLQALKPIPRVLKNLLAKLMIRCEYEGCEAIVKLDVLKDHMKECDYNPSKPVLCSEGCGLTIPKERVKEHHCIGDLRDFLNSQASIYEDKFKQARSQIIEICREVEDLKERVQTLTNRAFHRHYPRTVTNSIQNEEIAAWVASLQRAKVTRWGGIISTPDMDLQASIKQALVESGCPSHIVNELMENAHEMRWPSGLLTLETRQINQRQYRQYVCKRIMNKQAVVVMACDNAHMSDDMIIEPGLVMIFAHGIE